MTRGADEGFSNACLWPLYHDRIRQPEFRRDWWQHYARANEQLACAADAWSAREATVWIHDYQLQLVPHLLRKRRPDLLIGFFLHTPFPPPELFDQLPWREALLQGLLGADLIGFQTPDGVENFRRLVRSHFGCTRKGRAILYQGRRVSLGAFPVSVDFERFSRAARGARILRRAAAVRTRVGPGRKILLGVDRLDYTKGIDKRLGALRELAATGALRPDTWALIQVAVPSRERIGEYRAIRRQIDELVGKTNGDHGAIGHPIVHYLHKRLSFGELVSLYLAADVLLATPLRQGMNLVAKEYVAARADERGAVVLSEFCGAARELERASIVNPHDRHGLALTIDGALRLSPAQQARRMRAMRRAVRGHDVHAWMRSFLKELRATKRDLDAVLPERIAAAPH